MFRRLFRRSEIKTTDGINPWHLPRFHRAVYMQKLSKMRRLLREKEININKLDRKGRLVEFIVYYLLLFEVTSAR